MSKQIPEASEGLRVERAEQRVQTLRSLVDAVACINSNIEPGALLREIMSRSRQMMDADASTLMLLDESGEYLLFEVALAGEGQTSHENRRLPVGQGIAGHVARTGESYLTNDAYNCPLFFRGYDDDTGFRSRSILCVPMFVDRRLIGVCQVINRKNGCDFTAEDVELFEMFGNVCAVAIDNCRLRDARESHLRLESEMGLAREIQDSFLPECFPEVPGITYEAHTDPASYVGGDLYDVFSIRSGKVVSLIGDVSGKGASASLYGARMLSELRLLLEFCDRPEQVMSRVNDLMYSRSLRGTFITLLLMLQKPGSAELQIISAGHPMPLIYDPEREEFLDVKASRSPPLGVLPGLDFESVTLNCPARGIVLAYTDGMVEARNSGGEEYGLDRLRRSLTACAGDAKLLPGVLRRLTEFVGTAAQHDDATLLCARRVPVVFRELNLTSDPERHVEARTAVREFVHASGFATRDTQRIELAVGEALANVTEHCYGGELDRPIRVRLERCGGWLTIRIEDEGPFVRPESLPDQPTPPLEPGGLGLQFMRMVMDEVRFEPGAKSGNVLTLKRRLPESEISSERE